MARQRRKGRPCKFETLETRNLLAGDVTARILNGDLIIKGDDLANGITITAGATAGTVVITGVDAGGSATTVSDITNGPATGTPNGTVTLSGFTGKLKIKMKDGNDTVSITDLTVAGKANLDGGDGNDAFTVSGVTFNKSLDLDLDEGNDTASLTDVHVTGEAEIKGGRGDDNVTITDSTFGELETKLGRGNDTLNIAGTTVSEETELDGGRGTNTFTNGTGNSLAGLEEKNFGGYDDSSTTPSETSPTLSISGASNVNEGSLYTLNLSSTGTGGSTISKWTITWGDGSAAQDVTGDPSSVTHTYTDGAATRTISATATNPSGTFNAGNTVAVTVGNVAPTLSISGPATISEGSLYTLNLSSSDPGADTISQWVINWGDGSAAQTVTGNPSTVTHTFTDGPATRTISATATDEDGTVNATGTVVVTVNNVAPALTIGGATSVNEGALYTLNLSSTDPGADTISQWTINWGDSTPSQVVTGNPSSVTHTFADGAGIRTILATATDEDSTFAAANTLAVIVGNVAPTLAISGAASVNEGALYTLNLSSTDPGADTISQWSINWGDGTPLQTVVGNPANVTHTFADGTFTRTISATATDEDGTFNAGNTVAVAVSNIAPTLSISGASSIDEGLLYTLNLSSTDPGADTISQWSINWGDGTPVQVVNGNPTSVTHTFADGPADVTISATATDEDGTFAAGNTVAVTINNVAPTVSLVGPTTVDEGATNYWELSNPFDPGDDGVSDIIVHWGDGNTQSFPAGQLAGSGLIGHAYEQGTATYTITVDLVDEDGTYLSVATLDVTVNNVGPNVFLDYIPYVFENSAATLTGSYVDPDSLDAQMLTVNWGDPNNSQVSTFALPASPVLTAGDTFNSSTDGAVLTVTAVNFGSVSFSVQHSYRDDGVAPGDNIESNTSMIVVTVADDEGASNTSLTYVQVLDVAATLELDSLAEISEQDFLTFSGSYTDVSVLDAQTLVIYWNDPNSVANSTFAVPAIQDSAGTPTLSVGQTINSTTDGAILTITSIDAPTGKVGFSTEHQYLDDGTPDDGYGVYYPSVSSTITGDDSPVTLSYRYGAVHNLVPSVTVDSVPDVSESGSVTLTGTFADLGLLDSHTLSVVWDYPYTSTLYYSIPAIQDASGTPTLHVGDTFLSGFDLSLLTITSVNAATGEVGFSLSHQYWDDGLSIGNGTPSDSTTISLYVSDDDGQGSGTTTSLTVHNVAPTLTFDPVSGISEGLAVLYGSYTDVGIYDAHTITVNWGDPNDTSFSTFNVQPIQYTYGYPLYIGSLYYSWTDNAVLVVTNVDISTGTVAFSVQRQYADDGAAPGNGTISDLATIDLTVYDDDAESATARRFVTINNKAPAVSLDSVNGITENGFATVTGSFTDPGIVDAHTLSINWGDPNYGADTTFNLPATAYLGYGSYSSSDFSSYLTINSIDQSIGQVGFSVQHQYLDDGLAPGNATDGDISAISVTVADDDGQSGASTRFVTVSNASPTIALNPTFVVVPVGSTATLLGSYSDGLLDAQSMAIVWGDSSADSTFAIPAIQNAAGASTLNVGDTFSSSTDSAVLTVDSIDHSIGQVGFSVQHQYAITGLMTVNANITDDDLGGATGGTAFFVIPNIV